MPNPDPSAFLTRFLPAEADLRAFIGALVREPGAREDIFQEVALTLWEKFAEYDAARPFGAWARGVAAKKVLHARRKDARFPAALSPEAMEAVAEAFARRPPVSTDRAEALKACLGQLTPRARKLVALRYEDGLSCLDIAGRVGMAAAAVYQALSRARVALDRCIRQSVS